MKKRYPLILLLLTFVIASCSDNGSGPDTQLPDLSSVYVINEGNFNQSNGSISAYNPETEESIVAAFKNANGNSFTGYIQGSAVIGSRLYIVSNMPNKIEVIDLETLSSLGSIELSKDPTAIVSAGEGQAYVANLYDNSLTVLDLDAMEETDQTISVGIQPREMINVDGKVFVSNSGGVQTSSVDNSISVVNTETNEVSKTIQVGDKPGKMILDSSNNIWLICSGLTAYDENWNRAPEEDTPGSLYVIDVESETVHESRTLSKRPSDFALNERGNRAYLLTDEIEVYNTNSFAVVDTSFINRSFNSVGYSPSEEYLYTGKSNGLDQNGQTIRYNLEGTAIDSFEVGISPIGFQFINAD